MVRRLANELQESISVSLALPLSTRNSRASLFSWHFPLALGIKIKSFASEALSYHNLTLIPLSLSFPILELMELKELMELNAEPSRGLDGPCTPWDPSTAKVWEWPKSHPLWLAHIACLARHSRAAFPHCPARRRSERGVGWASARHPLHSTEREGGARSQSTADTFRA